MAEAVRAIGLACNLTLVVPGMVLAVLAGRWAAPSGAAYVISVAMVRWCQTAGWIEAPDDQLAAIPVLLAVAVMGAATVSRAPWAPAAGVAGGAGVGAVMALLWRPCTGEALGDAITTTISDPIPGLMPLSAYSVIVCLPVVAVAAATAAVPRFGQAIQHRASTAGAGLLALVIVGTLATGRWHDLVGELYRRSGG